MKRAWALAARRGATRAWHRDARRRDRRSLDDPIPAGTDGATPWPKPTSSTPCARPSASAAAASSQVHPADLGAHAITALDRAHGHRPGRGRGRRVRLRRHHRPAGRRHRAHVLARRRPARRRARHDRRPPVRLVAAGGALRGAGRDERHAATSSSPGGVQNMSMIPISVGDDASAEQFGFDRSVHGLEGLERALRRPGGVAVPRRRDDRREVGHLARGHGGVRGREPRARAAGAATRVASSARSSPLGERRARRRAAREHDAREDRARCKTLDRGRPAHRRASSSQISDGVGRAARSRREQAVKDARPQAAGAHPPPQRARRRPDLDAHRADPGDRVRAREDRA